MYSIFIYSWQNDYLYTLIFISFKQMQIIILIETILMPFLYVFIKYKTKTCSSKIILFNCESVKILWNETVFVHLAYSWYILMLVIQKKF